MLFSSDVCLSVCLSVCAQWTGQSDQFGRYMLIAPKHLKYIPQIRQACLQEQYVCNPLNLFDKWVSLGSCDALKFSALNSNSSKIVKVMNFKYDVHVPRDSLDMSL